MSVANILHRTAIGAALAVSALSAHAIAAVAQDYTFHFTGACADCTAPGGGSNVVTGSVSLTNYIFGSALQLENFVSFTYNGSNIVNAFTVSNPQPYHGENYNEVYSISGAFTMVPGFNDFSIEFIDGLHFATTAGGDWSVCSVGVNGFYSGSSCFAEISQDFGDQGSGSYSLAATVPNDIPEPGSLALLGLGLLGVAAMRRRQV